jgi:prophage regulatory protein
MCLIKFNNSNHKNMTHKILRIPQVMEMTGQSRSNIYLLMGKGNFPKSIKISERSIGWLQSEIVLWIESKLRNGGEYAGK